MKTQKITPYINGIKQGLGFVLIIVLTGIIYATGTRTTTSPTLISNDNSLYTDSGNILTSTKWNELVNKVKNIIGINDSVIIKGSVIKKNGIIGNTIIYGDSCSYIGTKYKCISQLNGGIQGFIATPVNQDYKTWYIKDSEYNRRSVCAALGLWYNTGDNVITTSISGKCNTSNVWDFTGLNCVNTVDIISTIDCTGY